MKLLIMTRGRAGNQITLRSIPYPWRDQTYLVCPMSEVGHHEWPQTIGVPDYVEEQAGTSISDASDYPDTDGDQVPDYVEIYVDGSPLTAM